MASWYSLVLLLYWLLLLFSRPVHRVFLRFFPGFLFSLCSCCLFTFCHCFLFMLPRTATCLSVLILAADPVVPLLFKACCCALLKMKWPSYFCFGKLSKYGCSNLKHWSRRVQNYCDIAFNTFNVWRCVLTELSLGHWCVHQYDHRYHLFCFIFMLAHVLTLTLADTPFSCSSEGLFLPWLFFDDLRWEL